ncbi:Ribosomal protein S14 [Corchorus capsularis]|uniref:Small ribosomal subunit protein uS14m n=1 Tax=Corchorus capsularis TaxID=210143 RepID=A0A1R3KC13_COCAP|nr:Ribosomal protein S14 [Corchorus capsularis]
MFRQASSFLARTTTTISTTWRMGRAFSTDVPANTASSIINPRPAFPPKVPSASMISSKISEKRNLRDHKRRLLAAKYELRRKLYKAFCKDSDLPNDLREKNRYKLSKLPRNSSFARVRNRCIFTGRPRSVYEFFRMSRIVFRGLASRGELMGVKKASW